MNDISNFYDEMDLKYPEIGIAMDRIDRLNPGLIRFSIPVLVPNMDNSKTYNGTIHQNTTNLKNDPSVKYEIDNIYISNYITIPMPKEVCAFIPSSFTITSGNINSPSVIMTGFSDHNIHGTGSMNQLSGSINIQYHDSERYIEPGSKWIIVFVGGDSTKPRVIARYTE